LLNTRSITSSCLVTSAKSKNSFTLVEMILAVAIFAIISVSLYASFQGGIFAYRRLNNVNEAVRKEYRVFEALDKELKNAFIFGDIIEFNGEAGAISFAPLNYEEISRVSYRTEDNNLIRTSELLSGIYQGITPEEKVILGGVDNFNISYAYSDPDNTETGLKWEDSWSDPATLPFLIKVTLDNAWRYVELPSGKLL